MKKSISALAVMLAVTAVYFCEGKLGLSLAFVNASTTAVWPPTGIALAAVLLLGRSAVPGVFLGAFLVNHSITGSGAVVSLCIALGNTAEAILGAELVTRFAGGRNAFDRAQDVFAFVLGAVFISTAVAATVGSSSLEAGGIAGHQGYGAIWLTWWLGDAVSAAVVAPLILIWATKSRPRWDVRQWSEAICLIILLVLISQIVFGGWKHSGGKVYPLEYLVIPLLLWATFRFGQHGAVTAVAIMSAIAIRGTLRGAGPFATGEANTSLLFLQAFMGTMTVTALVLASVLIERERTEGSLRESEHRFRELAAKERSALADAERASKAKDEFLAVLSHELRTPLTPVLLTITLLESHVELPAEMREELLTIRHNVELESRLIGDLLDLTRIERGKLQLDFQEVDVHLLIRAAAEIRRQADGASPSIELRASNHFVRGDSARLQQVFWNLIDNAQKFTPPEGSITVRSSDVEGGRILIEVSDSGVGIEPGILPKLFHAFEQGDSRTTRQFGGLGLGLAISKRLVDAHRGTITARSAGKWKGSTFTVELPVIKKPANESLKPKVDLPAQPAASLSILLVEDHAPTLEVLAKLLAMLGHRVTPTSTLASATAAAQGERFDVLISDLGLPDGSGLELMRQLHHQYAGRGIALTGYGMAQDLQDSHDAGFAAHLIKPIDFRRLQAAIEEIRSSSNVGK